MSRRTVCAIALAALAGCGSPSLFLIECPVDRNRRLSGACAPMLDVRADREGDLYRFWGRLSAAEPGESLHNARVTVVETSRRVEIGRDGRFVIDSLRAHHTLRFSADDHRNLHRNVGTLYDLVRG